MSDKKVLTCTVCPIGCEITVELDGKDIKNITGNTCKRGEGYAKNEITAPKRTVTTTAVTNKGVMLPVKTESAVPKELMHEVVKEISAVTVKTPVCIGDVIIDNVCGTGVNVVAAKNVE